MASIEIEHVSKRFDREHYALRDVNLRIADGELVTLVGPSGCGKSTLLNLIAGLDDVTEGTIRIDGVDVTTRPAGSRDIAMVFQSYALYPHMTVRKNIAFPLEIAGRTQREIDERVNTTAERLGLAALLDRKPSQLSGGQRQRVALGRALVRDPKAFLLDEPLSNLDAALRTRMRGELKKLHRSIRGTFVYVTHDQAEAMTLSDRVVVLSKGVVQQIGAPRDIYDRPENRFVAEFFGQPPMQVVAPATLGLPAREGVSVGIRPEHVRVVDAGGIAARVDLVEPMGAESWVTFDIEGTAVMARVPADLAIEPGEPREIAIAHDAVAYFDDASGKRID